MKQLNTGSVSKLIYSAALLYLLLPFLLFTLFWLRLPYSLLLGAILSYCLVVSFQRFTRSSLRIELQAIQKKQLWISAAILAVWLVFSGIGGFSYQNSDFEVRNAIFRDLIQQQWPVVYNADIYPSTHHMANEHLLLVYYFGYWLPAALIGKLLGWTVGNIFLYLWSFLGLLLTFALLCQYVKKVSYKIALLLVFWSGLDIVGSLIALYAGNSVPELGVIAHIERWANSINVPAQFSSNTTLLYWVFNQTIPIWLTILLLINNTGKKAMFFVIALSLFQAPLGTIGLVPFVLFQLIRRLYEVGFKSLLNEYLSIPNTVGALVVVGITGLYFTMNQAGSLRSIVTYDPLNYATFFLLEAGMLGLWLYTRQRSNLLLLSICVLLVVPFVKIGLNSDFSMRASIPALFILMALTIRFLFDNTYSLASKLPIAVFLLIGSVTPALEMARSLFFTSSHVVYSLNSYFNLSDNPLVPASVKGKIKDRTFLYDQIKTLNKYNKGILIDQFVGRVGNQPFCRYLLNTNSDAFEQPTRLPALPVVRAEKDPLK
ncbi:hypothetical protein [Spirosoma endophyticum]|uniref:4-amino-4-deoxy-L-arabinose transferase n=1 Tax=Spirosoma endophyticum TaxID=662367 RepID=A0A1I2H8Z9_9BACT|nr:hypothetical protein [Spirosoma endophyticum]SFF26685.1 hypothetical protein SAMN05216167_1403 [Spirosoma endophyticum]